MRNTIIVTASLLLTGAVCAQNTNCQQAIQICNDAAFSGNNGGYGSQEMPNNNTTDGCLTLEHQSSWYYFQPITSGTVEFTIETEVDYDFAIWTGPCSNLGSPVRCSYSATYGSTGLGNNANDVSEGSSGNKWVRPLDVTAGQTYILLIDNYTSSSTPFTISWNLYNGATLNCDPVALPVELTAFYAAYDAQKEVNYIAWQTASENENDYFTLERSDDGLDWTSITAVDGAYNSTLTHNYEFTDVSFRKGRVNYYRLSQTNMNGQRKTFDMISVDNSYDRRKVVTVMNLVGQKVPDDTKGMVIVMYEDGVTQRLFRP